MKTVEAAAINVRKRSNATADANAAVVGGLAHDNGIEATTTSDHPPQATAIRKTRNDDADDPNIAVTAS